RDRGRTPVDRVEPVRVDIVGEARGTADAGDEDVIFARLLEIGQDLLNLGQDGVVAATRTPADFLVGHEVLAGKGRGLGRFGRRGCILYAHFLFSFGSARRLMPRIPSMISLTLNGCPWTLFRLFALTRNFARRSMQSWPKFSSGTMMVSKRDRT